MTTGALPETCAQKLPVSSCWMRLPAEVCSSWICLIPSWMMAPALLMYSEVKLSFAADGAYDENADTGLEHLANAPLTEQEPVGSNMLPLATSTANMLAQTSTIQDRLRVTNIA